MRDPAMFIGAAILVCAQPDLMALPLTALVAASPLWLRFRSAHIAARVANAWRWP